MKEKQLLSYALGRLYHERRWLYSDRANSGQVNVTNKKTKKQYIIRLHKEGTTDILGCIAPRGRMFGMELKVDGKDLKPNQEVFRDYILSLGGFHFEARSPEEVDIAIDVLKGIYAGELIEYSFVPADIAFPRAEVTA